MPESSANKETDNIDLLDADLPLLTSTRESSMQKSRNSKVTRQNKAANTYLFEINLDRSLNNEDYLSD